MTKEHEDRLKVTLKYQRKSSFSLITYMQAQHRINGTWYRWICTSMTLFTRGTMGCIVDGDMSENMRTAKNPTMEL